ncbi:MAG: hypothetical protein E7266_06320 [Lachnospiraceae bacterium]|nr:hypothetical protein [Lachnospiraceae bacterium]
MKRMLPIEFRRLFRSYSFYMAIAIGLLFPISYLIQYIIPYAVANASGSYIESGVIPHSVFEYPLGRGSFHESILANIAPLLVAIPYGYSYYRDKKTGYIKNLFTRSEKKNYLVSKYIVTFFSGGVVLALPWLVSFIGNLMFLPYIKPIAGSHLFPMGGTVMWSELFYSFPSLYILVFCTRCFIIGGLLACMCLSATYIVNGIFLVELFPFIFVTVFNMLVPVVDTKGGLLNSTQNILDIEISGGGMTYLAVFLTMAVFALVSVIYVVCSAREDSL